MCKEKYLQIKNPNEALQKISTAEELSVQEIEDLLLEYAEVHGVTIDDMAYYPNGVGVMWNL